MNLPHNKEPHAAGHLPRRATQRRLVHLKGQMSHTRSCALNATRRPRTALLPDPARRPTRAIKCRSSGHFIPISLHPHEFRGCGTDGSQLAETAATLGENLRGRRAGFRSYNPHVMARGPPCKVWYCGMCCRCPFIWATSRERSDNFTHI